MADADGAALELKANAGGAIAMDEPKPIQYTVFLIDGCFGDICEPDVGYLRFDAVW